MARKKKTDTNKLYYVSWSGNGATYTRCFETLEQREYFINTLLNPKAKHDTWENERGETSNES